MSSSSTTATSPLSSWSVFVETSILTALLLPFGWDSEDDDDDEGEAREKVRWTKGESSVSTERAWRAEVARRCVGSGVWIVLVGLGEVRTERVFFLKIKKK